MSSAPQPEPAAAGETVLIARIRAGDQGAMAVLYDRYSSVVYAVAMRVLGDTGAAEDVLQDVFMQLWRHPEAFDASRGRMSAWLAVITRHRAIDALRKRRPSVELDEVMVSVDADLENAADRSRAMDKVRKVLGGLPGEQRKTLEMAFFEGLTHTEIAARTGEPLGTVKTRIRAALLTLRKAMAA